MATFLLGRVKDAAHFPPERLSLITAGLEASLKHCRASRRTLTALFYLLGRQTVRTDVPLNRGGLGLTPHLKDVAVGPNSGCGGINKQINKRWRTAVQIRARVKNSQTEDAVVNRGGGSKGAWILYQP